MAAIPLGNDMMQIDVSGDIVHARADTQRMAFQKAAKATIEDGYDFFIVVENKGWTEPQSMDSPYGTLDGNASGFDGWGFGGGSTYRMPVSTMVIKMFRKGDKGAEKALDARQYLQTQGTPCG